MMHGNLINPPSFYAEFRIEIHEAQMRTKRKIRETMAAFQEKFGRSYGNGLVEPYRAEDAEVFLMGVEDLAKRAEDAVDQMRDQGYKVGAVRVRTFRPFPTEELLQYTRKVQFIGVVDRSISYGSPTGEPVSTELMSICQRDPDSKDTHILPFVAGLGGRDVSVEEQTNQIKLLFEYKENNEEPTTKEKLFGTFWNGITYRKNSV